jgi:hypothetical protein
MDPDLSLATRLVLKSIHTITENVELTILTFADRHEPSDTTRRRFARYLCILVKIQVSFCVGKDSLFSGEHLVVILHLTDLESINVLPRNRGTFFLLVAITGTSHRADGQASEKAIKEIRV